MKKASKTLAVLLSVLLLFSFGTTVFADETTVPVSDPTPEVTSSPEPSTEPEPSETPEASPLESPAPEIPEEESSAPETSTPEEDGTESSAETPSAESSTAPAALTAAKLAPTAEQSLQEQINGGAGEITVSGKVTESLVIPKGRTVTIVLEDGATLTNDEGKHTIENSGTLTVTGSGTIDNVTHGHGALVNYGTATLEGGTLTRSAEASTGPSDNGGNSWYVIDNHGSLTIKENAVVRNNGYFSSLIRNIGDSADSPATLTISGGEISQKDFIAIKNDDFGKLSITGGTFNSGNQAVQNWSEATISGGNFETGDIITWSYEGSNSTTEISGGAVINGDVKAVNYDGGSSVASVTITGGTINGKLVKGTYNGGIVPADPTETSSSIQVSGGTFSGISSDEISAFVKDGYTTTGSDGSFTITDATEPTEDSVAETGGIYYKSVQNAINAAEGGATVTLVRSVNEDIVVSGKEITLDLGENTLTNVSGDTITVKIDANLTVVGSGTVDNKSNARAAIFNEGTVTLNGGTYDRTSESGESADISGGNSWYTICNHGSMTIHDGATVKNTGSFSSMIENGYYSYKSGDARTGYISGANAANPTLVIEGGEFVGGLNTVKNDDGGKLYIHGGSFSNSAQAAVLNWNVTEITGGNFEVTTKYAVVLNGKDTGNTNNGEVLNQGNLSITGGSFTAPKGTPVIEGMKTNTDMSDVKVSGGTFSSNVGAFVVKGAEVYEDENGNFGIRPAQGSAVAINGVGYATMQDAVDAIATSESKTGTITVLKDIPNATGVKVPEELNLTIDFADHTYTLSGPGAGSTNTETNGFQLLKNSNIVFKNGTINIAKNANSIKRMVQNYANLTLEDMRFEAANQVDGENYALSFNNGNIVFKGNTSIITTSDDTIAFDVCKFSNYEGVSVTFNDDYTGEINGRIVYDSPDSSNWSLTVNGNGKFGGIDLSATATAEPNITVTGGTFESDPMAYVADSSSAVRYTSNGQSHFAVGAASIRDTAAQAADDSAIDVLQGDVSVDITADNVTVSNSGKGTVSVNKTPVESGSSMEVHRLEKVEAKAATCKEEGHKAYYKCAECGELFEDANGTIPTTAAAVTIPKTEHSFGEWEVTKPATTTEKGEKQRTCSICGLVETAEIPLLDKPDPDPSTEPTPVPSTEPSAAPSTEPTAAPSAAPTEKPATSGPQTGDEGVSAVWIALLAISGCAVTLLSVKRRKS